jgi:hypothetical protein
MSITVNSRIVAEARIQDVTLRPVVGAYELLFGLDLAVNPQYESARRVSVIGARVSLRTDGGGLKQMGFARPELPIDIRQGPYPNRMMPALVLSLQPGQLAALECFRATGDVTFELMASGVGNDENGEQPMQDEWRIKIPRSDWLQKLRGAGARDILLFEVSLPLMDQPKEWAAITRDLQQAEAHFRDGDHRACVALCRTVLDEVGHQKFGKKDWAGPLLDRLATDRTSMSGGEREAALWAAVRHYAHLAHHGASDGGVTYYSRPEAQLVLTLVASLVGLCQSA